MERADKVPKDQLKEVTESLANTALTQLEVGDDVGEFAHTKVEFGYIYLRGGEYEALFKVMTDKKTVYFAVQQGKLMRLQDTFSEEPFQRTVQQMETFHGDWK